MIEQLLYSKCSDYLSELNEQRNELEQRRRTVADLESSLYSSLANQVQVTGEGKKHFHCWQRDIA